MHESVLVLRAETAEARALATGERVFLCSRKPEAPGLPWLRVEGLGARPLLPAGAFVGASACAKRTPLLQVLCGFWLPDAQGQALWGNWARVVGDSLILPENGLMVSTWKEGLSLAAVTLSDKGAAGERKDVSGPEIEALAGGVLPLCLAQGFILPDEVRDIRALLVDLALRQRFDLILTSGGTGLSPRDVTPEATSAVLERRLEGFERAMTLASLAKTPHGAISRACAGTLGQSIIVNLPGSLKAVRENLAPLLPTLAHALAKLQGDPSDCGG